MTRPTDNAVSIEGLVNLAWSMVYRKEWIGNRHKDKASAVRSVYQAIVLDPVFDRFWGTRTCRVAMEIVREEFGIVEDK